MALPFINIRRAKKTSSDDQVPKIEWSVAKEAEEFLLKSCKDKIRVVSYCGEYRHGKSYMAGRSVNDREHFKTSSGVQAQTRGLQLSSKYMEGTNILVLDSEGLASPDSTITLDTQIMALAVLFSSKVVYNCPNKISSQAIDGLQCAIDCATWLTQKSGVASAAGERQKPHLLWLIRDFTLKLEDQTKNPMTPTSYLEMALQQSNNAKILQDSLSALFEKRICMALPPPSSNSYDLAEMKNLCPAFENGVHAVIENLKSTPAKLIDGAEMTGPVLLAMAQTMCQLLSTGDAPQLQTVWESVRATRLLEARTLTLECFSTRIAGLSTPDPKLSAWPLDQVMNVLKQALQVFESQPCEKKSSDCGNVVMSCLEHLHRASKHKLEQWKREVDSASPDILHLLPVELRDTLQHLLKQCADAEKENVQVKLECDNLQVTIDELTASQHPSLEHALNTAEQLRVLKQEHEILQHQLTETATTEQMFRAQIEARFAEARAQMQAKLEESKLLEQKHEQQRRELLQVQQQLQVAKEQSEKYEAETRALQNKLAIETRKRTTSEVQLGSATTELAFIKGKSEGLESEVKRLKTSDAERERKLKQFELANMFRTVANGLTTT